MTTINSNIAALAAANALRSSSADTNKLVSRLSTGNKIIDPSDDAAGLAISTVLGTRVSTLRAAFTSAAQAKSLTAVADAGLKSVSDVLKRLKDLSVQANSGSVTDAERSFLNQEFQALLSEINNTANSTKFNTTNLLNGSIAGSVTGTTNTFNSANTTTFGATQTLYTVSSALPSDGQTITVNGATVTFTTDSTRLDRVLVGADQTTTAANLSSFLNSSSDSRIAAFKYVSAGAVVSVTFSGGALATAFSISSANGTYTTGTAATATFATANTADGITEGRVSFTGSVKDNVVTDITRGGIITFTGTANAGVRNNKEFIGDITRFGGFSAQFLAADSVVLSIKVGDITYTSATIADTTPAADTTVTFTGRNADGTTTNAGQFQLTLRASNGTTVNGQTDANTYAARFTDAFKGVTFFQNRDVSSYAAGGAIITNGNVTGSLTGTSVDIRLSNFDNLTVGDVKITAPGAGNDNGIIEIVVNGKTFRSRTDVGTQLAANSYTILTNIDDPKEFIGFNNGGTITKFSTTDEAKSLETALEAAFGLDVGGKGLVFQVGAESTETIDVKIKGVTTSALGLDGTSISTAANATSASAKIDSAITTVTAIRSDVGALQSRFGFVSATLSAAIQNTDAARSIIADADVAQESTAFAAAQVKVLAGIAVLAQANQLPQNLLKLIG